MFLPNVVIIKSDMTTYLWLYIKEIRTLVLYDKIAKLLQIPHGIFALQVN